MKNAKQILPPRDREIRIIANIVCRDGCFTEVDSYDGLARWNESCQDWVNEFGLSIRMDYDAELIVLEWEEVGREFTLRGLPGKRWQEKSEAISMTRALKPLPLALPVPSWMSEVHHPAHRDLYKLSDAELEERMAAQDQFIRYLLDGRAGRAHLWGDHHEGACEIGRQLSNEAGVRWLRARREKRVKDSAARAKRKRKVLV